MPVKLVNAEVIMQSKASAQSEKKDKDLQEAGLSDEFRLENIGDSGEFYSQAGDPLMQSGN